jgi:hypothetical protein
MYFGGVMKFTMLLSLGIFLSLPEVGHCYTAYYGRDRTDGSRCRVSLENRDGLYVTSSYTGQEALVAYRLSNDILPKLGPYYFRAVSEKENGLSLNLFLGADDKPVLMIVEDDMDQEISSCSFK